MSRAADGGEARVGGVDVNDASRVKPQLGLVQTDERSFYWRLSARQNLRFFARLYDVPRGEADARIDALLERVHLTDAADRPFSTYSAGMKQRVAVIRALLHDPPIVVMDEPTRSLDPAASLELRHFVADELRDRDGKTILLATHNLAEAQAISDRIVVMAAGRVVVEGTVDEVRGWGIDERSYELVVRGDGELPELSFVTWSESPGDAAPDVASGTSTRRHRALLARDATPERAAASRDGGRFRGRGLSAGGFRSRRGLRSHRRHRAGAGGSRRAHGR